MWERLDKPKTLQVTKALIKEFHEMESVPRDRPMSERRLMVYERILAAGEFRPVTWASAYCKEVDTIYRVNGKHTSTLLAGLHEIPEFYVTVERYSCQTMEDVARLYATFDSRLGVRNSSDIILSFASTVSQFRELRKKTFTLSVAAASFDKWGMSYSSHHAAERAELLLDHIEFTVWLDKMLWSSNIKQKHGAHLWRAPVATAMLGTFNRNRKDSEHFWELVRDESHPSNSDPTRILAKYLSRFNVRMTMSKGKDTAPFREMYVKCLHAWNAWRKEAKTDLRYSPDAKIPAIL